VGLWVRSRIDAFYYVATFCPNFNTKKLSPSSKQLKQKFKNHRIVLKTYLHVALFPKIAFFSLLMCLRHNLLAILSHFVTLRSCDMNKPNIDKSEISTPKVYLLLQKGLNKKLKTTVVFE